MQAGKQKFGTWMLLLLYCLTITSTFAFSSGQSLHQPDLIGAEECRSTNSFDQFDHTSQIDLQLKSIKEKSEFSDGKKFLEDPFYFSNVCFSPIEIIESKGIPQEKETLPFSGTDIIFPFHYFF